MNSLPEYMPCRMCPQGKMYPSRRGIWHQYYQCQNNNCKDISGLPLAQYKEDESETDFGSGRFKSNRNDND